jgi:hypothetical protein
MKPAAAFSRRIVDPVNSVAWFAMDGLWLAKLDWPAYVATGLTLLTGAILLLMNRRVGQRLTDDLALNSWMWMNGLWLVSDLSGHDGLRHGAMAVGGLGAVLLAVAVWPSRAGEDGSIRLKKMRPGHR